MKQPPPHFSNTRGGCPHLFEAYSTPEAPDPCEWTQNYSYLKCDTVKTPNFMAPSRMHNKLPPRLEAFPSINVLATFLLNKSSTAQQPLSWTHPATLIVWGKINVKTSLQSLWHGNCIIELSALSGSITWLQWNVHFAGSDTIFPACEPWSQRQLTHG